MELLNALITIQSKLNAPKSKFNKFGKFNYRSLEDILTAIKPLLKELNCGIYFADEIVEHNEKLFLKTTLTFFNEEGKTISVTTEAGHALEKSGMDFAQISGAASSYARKYAMNALFCIDDSPEIDSDGYSQSQSKQAGADAYVSLFDEIKQCATFEQLTNLWATKGYLYQSDTQVMNAFSTKRKEFNQ